MIRPDLEEDYETLYPDGWRPDPYEHIMIPIGQCDRMCPLNETIERENHQRLSRFEVIPGTRPPRADLDLTMKEFKRSSVGRETTHNIDLRPWSVLKRSLYHLLLTICFEKDDWMFICDFVYDRLKAIRQDMVIQRIEGRRYIEVLEGSVRFLVYSMYKLTCTIKDYTKVEPCTTIIPLDGQVSGLDNYELNVVREMKLTMSCLRDCLNSLLVQYQEYVPNSPFRPLFESVNLIVNLPFLHGYVRDTTTDYQANSKLRNSDSIFKIVFKMYREHLSGNHWSALKNLPRLKNNPLLILAYAPALAYLQIHMVRLLKKAYSATGANTSSIEHLSSIICPQWLDYDEKERLSFARFIATQFEFYDDKKDICDYKLGKTKDSLNSLPRDFVEKAKIEQQKTVQVTKESFGDNETRMYAFQMIAGRDWSFFHKAIELYGIEYILNPSACGVGNKCS